MLPGYEHGEISVKLRKILVIAVKTGYFLLFQQPWCVKKPGCKGVCQQQINFHCQNFCLSDGNTASTRLSDTVTGFGGLLFCSELFSLQELKSRVGAAPVQHPKRCTRRVTTLLRAETLRTHSAGWNQWVPNVLSVSPNWISTVSNCFRNNCTHLNKAPSTFRASQFLFLWIQFWIKIIYLPQLNPSSLLLFLLIFLLNAT